MPLFPGNTTTTAPGLITLSGDLGGTYSSPTVININGASVPIAGALIDGYVLQVNDISSLKYAPINLAGGINYIIGLLPNTNQVSQTMGGDITGTTGSATVININGISVPAGPVVGQVLTATSSSSATWQSNIIFKRLFLLMGA